MKSLVTLIIVAALLCGNGLLADENIGGQLRPDNPKLVKLPIAWPNGDEATLVIFDDRPRMMSSYRHIGGGEEVMFLKVQDLTTSEEIPHFGDGFSFACGFVNGKELNMFATKTPQKEWPLDWTTDAYRFWTTDMKTWKKEIVLRRVGDKHILNTSVCSYPNGYLMAYESDGPTGWETRLARSKDLSKWEKIEGLEFTGVVFANPTIRY
jgi:hypothetical protein